MAVSFCCMILEAKSFWLSGSMAYSRIRARSSLGKLIENAEAPQPQAELIRTEMKEILERLLGMLTDRQQMVLRLHFGMEDGVCHSLEEIGTILGVSKERVRQIERQAMSRLLSLGAGVGLEDFLE